MLLRSNTFTSSGNTLLAPYDNVHKFAAIVLDDVERVVIGDSSEDASVDYNYFSNSNFGIRAYKSNFEVYHSDFISILDLDPQIDKLVGTAIYAQSVYDYNDRSIIIGNKNYANGTNSAQNHFLNLNNGIVASGEMNLKIFNNVFGNGDADARIRKYGIWTNGTWEKSVYITRENVFHDYYTGIRANMIHPRAVFHIGNNTFNDAYVSNWNAIKSFEGTAIYLANYFGMPVNLPFRVDPQVVIFDNTIGEYGSDIQPRIGIYASQIFEPVIQNNVINYYRNSPVTLPHSFGIWTQNCNSPFISSNSIRESQNSYPGYGANLIGIRSDRNLNPCIGNVNTIENLGYGVSFWDNNGQVGLSSNKFINCDHGVHLDRAEIGAQGNSDRTDDNEWTDRNVTPILSRVNGLTQQSNLPVQWYYKTTLPVFSPLPSNIVNATIVNSPNALPVACPIIQNVVSRNQTFGYVIGDSARYDETYQANFSFSAKVITYKALKRDTSIMYMDDDTDESFIDFYNAVSQTNIEKYDSVAHLIMQRDYINATDLLESIESTNDQETYLSNFYILYLTKIAYDSLLNTSDSTLLIEIAYSHSLLYGDAIYLARNVLFQEIHDEPLPSNLRKAVFKNKTVERVLTIQPNPASTSIQIQLNAMGYSGRLQLIDGKGHLVIDENIENGRLDVKNLNPGIYFIKVIDEVSNPLLSKLIIIR